MKLITILLLIGSGSLVLTASVGVYHSLTKGTQQEALFVSSKSPVVHVPTICNGPWSH